MNKKSSFIINNRCVEPPEDIIVTNYIDNGEPRFKYKKRKQPLTNIVLHETAGRTAEGCKRTLLKKGYGVQLILDRDGTVSCHGDLVLNQMKHGNQLNKTSIGIEVVNPYAPKLAKGMDVYTIPAEWWTWCPDKNDRNYVLPTQKQLDTLVILIPWLCEQLNIPYVFPTESLNRKKRKITGWMLRKKPKAGVVAHRDFAAHADGRYLLEYLMIYARP